MLLGFFEELKNRFHKSRFFVNLAPYFAATESRSVMGMDLVLDSLLFLFLLQLLNDGFSFLLLFSSSFFQTQCSLFSFHSLRI